MAIDTVVEEVADNLEEMAQVTRRLNTKSIGLVLGGAAVGFAVGFYFGYKKNKEKIKADAFRQSEHDIAQIREHYQQKVLAATEKPDLEEVIEERGYDRPLKAPVPGVIEPDSIRADLLTDEPDEKVVWDYQKELDHRVRNPDDPYVIHQEEYMAQETGYRQVAYTYYAVDDVLVGEDEFHPLPHADIIVGLNNLQFGHGTDDPDVVFVRNNEHQLEMEICRLHKSYEEEILGIENTEDDEDDEDD
jgi:preprotein translocase subunit Sss1